MRPHQWLAAVLLAIPPVVYSIDAEDARSVGCLPSESVQTPSSVCAACHADAPQRYADRHHHPCTQYCMQCHQKAEMDRHHTVGTPLPRDAHEALLLTSKKQIACVTCHNMSQPRHDKVRWKATSLFDRLFHNQSQYPTYFLAMRNDQGQLCLICH